MRTFCGSTRRIVFLLLVIICPASRLAGLCTNLGQGDTRHEFQFWAGYSPQSVTLIGTTEDRRIVLAGFDYAFRCWAWENISVSFAPGIMPAAILLQPSETFVVNTLPNGPRFRTVPAHGVYGFAVTPLGVRVDFRRQHRVSLLLQTEEGIIASTQRIPENVTDATGLNFLFDFGGGMRLRTGDRHAVDLGYKFLHVSNASTTDVNPGVDNNVFYIAFSILR